jgi:hypothetical protein
MSLEESKLVNAHVSKLCHSNLVTVLGGVVADDLLHVIVKVLKSTGQFSSGSVISIVGCNEIAKRVCGIVPRIRHVIIDDVDLKLIHVFR